MEQVSAWLEVTLFNDYPNNAICPISAIELGSAVTSVKTQVAVLALLDSNVNTNYNKNPQHTHVVIIRL